MSSLKHLSESRNPVEPESLDHFFPPDRQRIYVSMLMGRGGLTRRRAEYFVRLWAYLLLKDQQERGTGLPEPLTQLYPPAGSVACTHREAAELFYGNQERGSDRAAGMMIDRLVALGLIDKQFDGQTLCLQICSIPELAIAAQKPAEPFTLEPDSFNPRTDAIPVANLFTRAYAEIVKDSAAASHKLAKLLRYWTQQYPKVVRVLRRSDNLNPVAFYILYPVASESEIHFFQPPGKSFYLSNDVEEDPFKMATPGDSHCTSIYIRAWVIDVAYLQKANLKLMLQDTRDSLVEIQKDFPGICDLYSLIIHPLHEELRLALGFQKTFQDAQRPYSWVYLGLDRLLELDIDQALANLKLTPTAKL